MRYFKWTQKRMAALAYGNGNPSVFPTYSVARPLERAGLLTWNGGTWRITGKGRALLFCWYFKYR